MRALQAYSHRGVLFLGFLITCLLLLPAIPVVALAWLVIGKQTASALAYWLCNLLMSQPFGR